MEGYLNRRPHQPHGTNFSRPGKELYENTLFQQI